MTLRNWKKLKLRSSWKHNFEIYKLENAIIKLGQHVNLERSLLTWQDRNYPGNFTLILETSLSSWKHHEEFGNKSIHLETLLLFWKQYLVSQKIVTFKCNKSEVSIFKSIFPSSQWGFQFDIDVSNLIKNFPS